MRSKAQQKTVNRKNTVTVKIPESIQDEWMIWRLVSRGIANLQEIDTHWTIVDVLKANDALDVLDEANSREK
jgi:hypothetical protein